MKVVLIVIITLLFPDFLLAQTVQAESVSFLDFTIIIHNFISENRPAISREYEDVIAEEHLLSDSVFLSENPCEDDGYYINGKTITIYPNQLTDSFTISIAYEMTLTEMVDTVNFENKEFQFTTPSYNVPQPFKNQFIIPCAWSESSKNARIAMVEEFNLTDTTVIIPGEFYRQINYSKNGILYADDWNFMVVKIKHFRNGNVKATKHIYIALTEGCD